jgi:hypothetical protein
MISLVETIKRLRSKQNMLPGAADSLPMTSYEIHQADAFIRWKAVPPGFATRTLGRATGPAADFIQDLIPVEALRMALDATRSVATYSVARNAILRQAGVADLAALDSGALEVCDALAARARRRAVTLAGGTGALFGLAGAPGMVADVPTLLVQTFRIIHQIGLCYGEDCSGPTGERLPIAIFALASANTEREKTESLTSLAEHAQEADWQLGLERAAQREFAKEAALVSLRNLTRVVARRLGWRLAGMSVPVAGAAVGGLVNALYLQDVARIAEFIFRDRWLRRRYPQAPGR